MNSLFFDGGAHENKVQFTEIESQILSIPLGVERHRRLIISGDSNIECRFYDYLAEIRGVYYLGRTPYITFSSKKSIKYLKKVAREVSGAVAIHAVTLTLKRTGVGVMGSIKAALFNNLPGPLSGRHKFEVVLVGNQNVVNQKLEELGVFVSDLEKKGYIKRGVAPVEDGKLQVISKKPVKLIGNVTFFEVVSFLKDKAAAVSSAAAQRFQNVSNVLPQVNHESNLVVNPASGLPIISDANYDIAGNVVGLNNMELTTSSALSNSEFRPTINPASGLPMVEGSIYDVNNNVFGHNNDQL